MANMYQMTIISYMSAVRWAQSIKVHNNSSSLLIMSVNTNYYM